MWIFSCLFIGVPIALQTYDDVFDCNRLYCKSNGCFKTIFEESLYMLLWLVLFCFGASFAIIICEIAGFAPLAGYMFLLEHERYMSGQKSVFTKKAFDFIFNNKSLYDPITESDSAGIEKVDGDAVVDTNQGMQYQWQQSKTQTKVVISNRIIFGQKEQLFRLIFINYCWIEYFGFTEDKKLIKYLNMEMKNEWSNVTLTTLGINSDDEDYSGLWSIVSAPFRILPKTFKRDIDVAMSDTDPYKGCYIFYRKCCLVYCYFILYVFIPLFVLSRLFSIFFPLIALIYFNFDIESIQLLQWILTILYVVFMTAWIISAIRCFYFYHWTIRFFPGLSYWDPGDDRRDISRNKRRLNLMQKYYNHRLNDKFVYNEGRKVVIEILGKDIGSLVVSFWPKFEFQQWLNDLKSELALAGIVFGDANESD